MRYFFQKASAYRVHVAPTNTWIVGAAKVQPRFVSRTSAEHVNGKGGFSWLLIQSVSMVRLFSLVVRLSDASSKGPTIIPTLHELRLY